MTDGVRVFDGGNVRLVQVDRDVALDGVGDSERGLRAADGTDWSSFHKDLTEVFQTAQLILEKKHRDYGPTNISDAPGGAINGIRVRLHDKFARINHLVDSGGSANYESIEDSFLDAMNYCAIALMVLRGRWQ